MRWSLILACFLHKHNLLFFLSFVMQGNKPNQTSTNTEKKEDNSNAIWRQVSERLENQANGFGEVPPTSPIPVKLPASPGNISPSRELYYM